MTEIAPLNKNNNRAVISMSGGVDSSVAAYIIKKMGYETIGVTMKLYDNEVIDESACKTCCSLDDIDDARNVANRLGIKYYVLDFECDFEHEVIERFVKAYEAGMTPNPCIDCNRYIKFKKLYLWAKELGQDYVVTGHYARVNFDEKSGRYQLLKAIDKKKDQSYVLYSITQEQLAHTIFPLGEMDSKEEVRRIAVEHGFINAGKHDSQDICFVPDKDYASFISRYRGKDYPCGEFVDMNGEVLGQHEGIIKYTIGQRKGLGLALKEPMYVCEKNIFDNKVILGKSEDLFKREFEVKDFNWIACEPPSEEIALSVKIRYSHKENKARVIPLSESKVRVIFDEPQRAITIGQSAVMYDGDIVYGGGIICKVL